METYLQLAILRVVVDLLHTLVNSLVHLPLDELLALFHGRVRWAAVQCRCQHVTNNPDPKEKGVGSRHEAGGR